MAFKKIADIQISRFLPRFLKSPSRSSNVAIYQDNNGNISIAKGQSTPTPIVSTSPGSTYYDNVLKLFIMFG